MRSALRQGCQRPAFADVDPLMRRNTVINTVVLCLTISMTMLSWLAFLSSFRADIMLNWTAFGTFVWCVMGVHTSVGIFLAFKAFRSISTSP